MTAPTNNAPGSAGQNGAPKSLRWEGSAGGSFGPNEILMADGHKFVGHFYVDASDGVDVDAVLRLIAAAPDLLEAVRLAVDLVDRDVIQVRPSDRSALLDALSSCHAAIAKAIGEGV